MLPCMARPKILSDHEVLTEARRLHQIGGDKALSFGALARATGLAASTLAQRFATIDGLQAAAAQDGWRVLIARAEDADLLAEGKGAPGYLKAQEGCAAEAARLLALGGRDPVSRNLAEAWRMQVETGLALRLGQGDRARMAAAALFALWQGQALWPGMELKLKDLARRLA